MNTQEYFENFEKEVNKIYEIAKEARKKGLDNTDIVEIPLAKSMAEKVVGLISSIYPQITDSGITERIHELEEEWGKLNVAVAFKIAEEIAKQKFCKFKTLLEAIDAGIRIGFAYITLGVVSSPIEGYTRLELGKRRDNGKEYFKVYFSGPIRSAGTTASVVVLMIVDYLREIFGYEKYDATEEEVKRYWIENHDYNERITNLQYMPTEEEALFIARGLPIQITGEPTEKKEVSNHKNLERIETNYLRGGMCLIFSEGIAQKAKKAMRLLNSVKKKGFISTGWDYLEEYIILHEKRDMGKADDAPTYIQDLVAGRPVFSHPSCSGGFRFRYGRGRSSGFSSSSVHPATMQITDGFLAIGTQLKIEKPTKGTAITSCDSIDGPVVKLFNGSVKKINDAEEAKRLYHDVEEIIYLGDILFPFSDLVNRNSNLIKPGYVEEWWKQELEEENKDFAKDINEFDINIEKAIEISRKYPIPFHPSHIFYWTQISKEQFLGLIDWLKNSRIIGGKVVLPFNKTEQKKFLIGKRSLELLAVEHDFVIENIVIKKDIAKALFVNLGIDLELLDKNVFMKDFIGEARYDLDDTVLDIVNKFSEFEIKDKAGEFIGARMGRPEKAKLRKLTGSPNVLFPVGNEGGRLRSVQEAASAKNIRGSFPIYYCIDCKKETIYKTCEDCGNKTRQKFFCSVCKEKSFERCKEHDIVRTHAYQSIDMSYYLQKAKEKIGISESEMPTLIKGVRGLSSESKQMEHLAKGILRAKNNLQVNKDGTIRYDATELPLLSFRPSEISVNIEKLKILGYDYDIYGKELVSEEQILELKPHDVILPSALSSPDEKADDVFVKITNFIDELLEKFYRMEKFYNVKTRDDLVGQIGVCMAPHNCAGVICRFIGFSNTLGLFASPYMHAAIRRDCDGDEASLMLLGDVLLNFSKTFLPEHRGGSQDAPLVLNAKIDAGEVDDQILDLEFVNRNYPLELYRLAEKKVHSSEVKSIENVADKLKENKDPFIGFGFTHDTFDFNAGVVISTYKTIPTMQEKVQRQMELVEKIRAADTSDTARLVLEKHFIRDIRGNLREFSKQSFRCVSCNEIMRRPPLTGVCIKCKGKIIFTVHEGGIRKYLEPALEIAEKYNLSKYLVQNIELTKRYINSIFGQDPEKQEKLAQWF